MGEDTLLTCDSCGYNANEERAHSVMDPNSLSSDKTLDSDTIRLLDQLDLAEFTKELSSAHAVSIKAGILDQDKSRAVLSIVPKGWSVNPIKVNKLDTIKRHGGFKPADLTHPTISSASDIIILLDDSISLTFDQSLPKSVYFEQADIRTAQVNDFCAPCHSKGKQSRLKSHQAIEIGHTFLLGTKYSEPLGATHKNSQGQEQVIQMGCFGIGVSRMVAAIVEASHDKDGIIWPWEVAPSQVCVIPGVSSDPEEAKKIADMADRVCRGLSEKSRVVLDDRDHPMGYKLKDSLLIGYPLTLVVGKKYLAEGMIEVKTRKTGLTRYLSPLTILSSDLKV